MVFDPQWSDAISSIESGGKYGILGPATRTGDQAYGKYQVMGSNIGPWTKEILGHAMSPQEFLANPQAQEAVFQGKFGQYAQKYGPEGAAKAWFAGEQGMKNPGAKDVLGTTVSGYAAKFANALGAPVGQPASVPGVPPNNSPQAALAGFGGRVGGGMQDAVGLVPQQPAQQSAPQQAYSGLLRPKRKQIDLSGLAALLQNAPPEVRGLLFRG